MTLPDGYLDHDQRFKALLREFFPDFLRLFFAEWAARFDLSNVEWMDTELLPDPPDGSRHRLDLIAKLTATAAPNPAESEENPAGEWLALVHVEVESPDRTTDIKARLPAYYLHLTERYGLPVLPVVLYLKVGLDGIGVDVVSRRFWELEVLRMQYLYVGLPGLNAEEYVQGENWLGVALAALMRIPPEQASELGLEALRRIQAAGLSDQHQFLLNDVVETYLPVEDAEMDRISGIVTGEAPKRGKIMHRRKTSYDRMWEARWEGQRTARLELLEAQLTTKFGPLSPEQLTVLRAMTDADLQALGVKFVSAPSLSDLGL